MTIILINYLDVFSGILYDISSPIACQGVFLILGDYHLSAFTLEGLVSPSA